MMINIYRMDDMSEDDLLRITQRCSSDLDEVKDSVRKIIDYVKFKGDEALLHYTEIFDGSRPDNLRVTQEEISQAYEMVDNGLIERLREQISYSTEFHKRQLKEDWKAEFGDGIILGERYTPIDSVGLYVPGGRAAYPSVLQILAVPAILARVPRIVVCTPTDKEGKVPAPVLVAADILGLKEIYKVGGAQAIAAMAYGTESIAPVHKIVGPGNIYVNCAKLLVFGKTDIDMLAGPSEALIIADGSAVPSFAAADMLARCEHDPRASAVLVTDSEEFASAVRDQIDKQLIGLKRQAIIKDSMLNYSGIIICRDMDQMIEFANEYAPEHLELMVEEPWKFLPMIRNAGSIFLGNYAPVAVGDYASGTNHVLPTGQYAKVFSPVGVDTFLKRSEFQFLSKEGLKSLEPIVREISQVEGLDAHYNSVEVRLS